MGESAEEGEAGGLEAPPRLPPERAGVAVAGDCRRLRAAVEAVERAGAAEARLLTVAPLLSEAGGSTAGAALAGATAGTAVVGATGGLTAAGLTLDGGLLAAGWLAAAAADGEDAAAGELAVAVPAAAAVGVLRAAGAALAAVLALLRVREVRLAIAQVGRGWRNG